MPPTSPAAERDGGLTLFEMLVVISIVALVTVGLPGLLSRDLPRHEATMRELSNTLRQARSEAIRDRAEVAVIFDLRRRLYGIGTPQTALADGLSLAVTSGLQVAERGLPTIRFYPDGTSSGGRVELTDSNETGVIEIRWLTGRIRRET